MTGVTGQSAPPPDTSSADHPVLHETGLPGLTRSLVGVPSVSGDEAALADLVESRLRRRAPQLAIHRIGNNVVARTQGNRPERVVFAGHLDTVPGAPAGPQTAAGPGEITGLGAVDMKGGIAIMLRLAEHACQPAAYEAAFVFYDKEEIGSRGSGMAMLFADHRELVDGDMAVVLEPTNGLIEAGCQGNLVIEFGFEGTRAHTARPWRGDNAIHRAVPALQRLARFVPEPVEMDGLVYRQALSVVAVSGGVQGNVVPDRCTVKVNYRHAPTLDGAAARDLLTGLVPEAAAATVLLSSPAAAPRLGHPLVARLLAAAGQAVRPKLGWTDVGRFAEHGIPAVNFGPGDPELAHTSREIVHRDALSACYQGLLTFLTGPQAQQPGRNPHGR